MEPYKDIFNRLKDRNKAKAVKKPPSNIVQFIEQAEESDIEKAFTENPEHFLKATDNNDNTIVHMAIAAKKQNLIPLFLKHKPELISKTNRENLSPIMFAVKKGASPNAVKLLLSCNAKPMDTHIRGRTILHMAAEENRFDLVGLIVNAGIDIDVRDNNMETPLLLALKGSHDNTANTLLKRGANPLSSDTRDTSPLHLALKNNCPKTVDILLKDNSVIQRLNHFKTCNRGTTPLMAAVAHSTFNVVDKMIKLGANINAKNTMDVSIFSYAMENQDKKTRDNILLLLLDKGIDFNKTDTPLTNAIARKVDTKVISALLDRNLDIDKLNIAGQSPIYHAINNEDIDVLHMLLDEGADPNNIAYRKSLPLDLLYSIEDSNKAFEMFKLLHEHGANIDDFGENDRTPLQSAARAGNVEIVEYLLQQNVDLDTKSKDYRKMSAFLFTLTKEDKPEQRFKIAESLYKKGAIIKTTDAQNNTALHHAAENGNIENLKWLCHIGLDINAKNDDNMTAQDKAISYQKTENVLYLAKQVSNDINHQNENGYTLLHRIAEQGKTKVLEKLLEQPYVDINARDRQGRTPLMLASYQGHSLAMEVLIKNGAKVNTIDKHGRTPLYYAVTKFLPSPVELLLKHGANMNIVPKKDRSGMLHHAAEATLPTLAGYFLKAGAKINRCDKDGNTPLHIAVRFKNEEVTEYLLANGASPTIRNKAGFTPHDIAKHKDYRQLMTLLRDYTEHIKNGGKDPLPPRNFRPPTPRNRWRY